MERAACRGMAPKAPGEPDPFFPGRGGQKLRELAQSICARCPVTAECETYRVETGSEHGIWAGRTAGSHHHEGKE